jgi:hypothetical protein
MAAFLPIILRVLGAVAVPIISKIIGSGNLIKLDDIPGYANQYKIMLKRMKDNKFDKKDIMAFEKATTIDDLEKIHQNLRGPKKTRMEFFINHLKNSLQKEVKAVVKKIHKKPTKTLLKKKKVLKKQIKGFPKTKDNVQSVVFDKDMFTILQAKKWLKEHGFKYGKVDKKLNTLRFRQMDPLTYKKYRTKKIIPGILFVLGFNK